MQDPCTTSWCRRIRTAVARTGILLAAASTASCTRSPAKEPSPHAAGDDYEWIHSFRSSVSPLSLVADGRGGAVWTALETVDDVCGARGRVGRIDASGRTLWETELDARSEATALCFGPSDEVLAFGTRRAGSKRCPSPASEEYLFVAALDGTGKLRYTARFPSQHSSARSLHRTADALFLVGETSSEVRLPDSVVRHPDATRDRIPARSAPFVIVLEPGGVFRRGFLLPVYRLHGSTTVGDLFVFGGHATTEATFNGAEISPGNFLMAVDAEGAAHFHQGAPADFNGFATVTSDAFDVEISAPASGASVHGLFSGLSPPYVSSIYRFDRAGNVVARRGLRHGGVASVLDAPWLPAVPERGKAPIARCSTHGTILANSAGEHLAPADRGYALMAPSGKIAWTRTTLGNRKNQDDQVSPAHDLALGDDGSIFEMSFYVLLSREGTGERHIDYLAKVKR